MGAGATNQFPLLKKDFIGAVADQYIPDPSEYIAGRYFPDEAADSDRIKIDEESPLNYGMTLPTFPEAESPIIKGGDIKQRYIDAAYFREKAVLRRGNLVQIRKPGYWLHTPLHLENLSQMP